MHNMNVFFAVTESALLGGLPVRWSEISLAPLVGCAYVIFTWSMSMSWNKREHGPQVRHGIAVGTEKSLMFNRLQNCFFQFIYFFFDTTLPGFAPSIALLALMIALLIFFVIFASCERIMEWADAGLAGSLTFVILICSAVMRFRDY